MKTHLRHRIVAGLAAGALVLAACGGDDDDGGGGSPQDQVADLLLTELEGEELEGVTVDEDCVRDVTGQLSDEDAEAIVEAGPDGDPDVSVSGEEIGFQILECVDIDLSEIDLDDLEG